MLNIHIKGKYECEEQLFHGKMLPSNAVQFREGKTISDAFQLGFILILPIMLPMVVLSVIRCSKLDKHLEFDGSFIVALAITFLLGKLLIYLHEFIHAIFYPREADKTIWRDTKQGAYFVYCDAKLTKNRFIVLSLAPSIILGIIPFFIWYVTVPFFMAEWIVCMMVLIWMMTFMSLGDYANAFNAMRQVPKSAKVFNHGMHTYWIE